jgi:hypothetical protein
VPAVIPASQPVTCFDPVTGQAVVYDQWVPVEIRISSPDNDAAATATPTSATFVLARCRTLPSGKTERLKESTARLLGVAHRSPEIMVPNIYADATDQTPPPAPEPYPPYPPDATDEERAAVDAERAEVDRRNANAQAEHLIRSAVYPAALRAVVLGQVMTPMVRATAIAGAARGGL